MKENTIRKILKGQASSLLRKIDDPQVSPANTEVQLEQFYTRCERFGVNADDVFTEVGESFVKPVVKQDAPKSVVHKPTKERAVKNSSERKNRVWQTVLRVHSDVLAEEAAKRLGYKVNSAKQDLSLIIKTLDTDSCNRGKKKSNI